MDRRIQAGLVVAVLAALGASAYLYNTLHDTPPAHAQSAVQTPAQEPSIRFPVPETSSATKEESALPALGSSDALAQKILAEIFGADRFATLFHRDALISRFVATVDSLPRPTTAQPVIPLQPIPSAFLVSRTDTEETVVIDARNQERYRPYVQLAEAADAKTFVATYIRLYPLFQAAYEELGYPDGYFNDRLVVAIDDLLDAPEVERPALVQPKTVYEFADPDLERRSSGQKLMIRMGTENAARLKTQLRAIRNELTRNASQVSSEGTR